MKPHNDDPAHPTALTEEEIARFREIIWDYYHRAGRQFPWRETSNPYHILVSEIMLQQTQTSRVLEKYQEFLLAFPDWDTLAVAPLSEVLRVWQGLGYNRRAIALHRIAAEVIHTYAGQLPSSQEDLRVLPGIGPNTAGAIAALAFDQPAAFIETNIRQVYLHFFFSDQENVPDRTILPLVETTMVREHVREWYWALYDYGANLKKEGNLTTKSAHYRKQTPFEGSNRERRSRILKLLLTNHPLTENEIIERLKLDHTQIKKNLRQLQTEGFLTINDDKIDLA